MPPHRCRASQTGLASSLGHSQACANGLWPAAIQPHVALVCRLSLHLRNACKYKDYYTHLPTTEGWKAELVSWQTHSRQFTHKAVTRRPQIGCMVGKVCRPKTDVLTTEPRLRGIRNIIFCAYFYCIFDQRTQQLTDGPDQYPSPKYTETHTSKKMKTPGSQTHICRAQKNKATNVEKSSEARWQHRIDAFSTQTIHFHVKTQPQHPMNTYVSAHRSSIIFHCSGPTSGYKT